MSGKYNQIISSEDPPELKKKRHIGCMAGILQLLDRHQIHFYGHKRISAARSSSGCGSPKSSSCVEHSNNLASSTQEPARFSVDSRKIARRSLDFKDVVRDSLQRIDHPLKASIITCSATVSEKPESVRFFTQPRDQSPRISPDVKDAGKQNIPLSLSPNIAEKTIEAAVSTESQEVLSVSPWNLVVDDNSETTPRSSFESRQYTAPARLSFVKDSPRFSCDGREISRPSTIERRDAAVLRCSSLKVRETSKLSPDTPSKRSPNVVARLMGLDEMPNSSSPVSVSKVVEWKKMSNTSPRTGKASVEFGKSVSEANNKDQERNDSEDHSDCFNGSANTLKISHSTVESPSHAQSPSSQKLDEVQNAAFNVYEKRRKLVGELENCDRDLQALKKIVEALQLKDAVRSVRTSENAETDSDHTPVVIMKPAKLAAKLALPSSSSISVQSESALLSPKHNIRPNRTVYQNGIAEDPKPSNTLRSKNVSKRINFGNGDSPVEQRRKPATGKLKMSGEGSNSAPASPSARSQSLMNNETIPSLKLKTLKSAAKEQRKNLVDMEIRVEKRRDNGDEESQNGDTGTVSRFNLQNSQVKRSLEFGPAVKKTISNGINEVSRADLKASGKPREIKAGMDLSTENPSEVPEQPSPVSVLDSSFYKDDTSPIPVIKRATLNFRENEDKRPEILQSKDDWSSQSLIPRKSEQAESRNSVELMDMDRYNKTLRDQHNLVQIKPKLTESAGLILQNHAEYHDKNKSNGKISPEHDYVKQIFTASGLLQVQENLSAGIFSSGSFPIDIEIFHDLEQKCMKSTPVAGRGDCSLLKQNRLLVFNTVNEILSGKFAVSPWIWLPHRIGGYNQLSGHGLLKQVLAEIERLQNVGCEDICDTLLNVLQKDLARCRDEEGAEMGDVVMDMERMLFRDLIDETVSEMVFYSSGCKGAPARCSRKLPFFSA